MCLQRKRQKAQRKESKESKQFYAIKKTMK